MTGKIPRAAGQDQRDLWRGAGDAWTWVTELVAATGVWAGIGYLFDRFVFHSWPAGFVVGAVVGNTTGIWWLYHKFSEISAREERKRQQPVRT